MRNMNNGHVYNRLAIVGATTAFALGGNAVAGANALNITPDNSPDTALTAQECVAKAIALPVINVGYNNRSVNTYKVTVRSLSVSEAGVISVIPFSPECQSLVDRKIEIQQSIETDKPNTYKVNSATQALSAKELLAYNNGQEAGAVFATRSAYKCVKGKGVRQTRATITMSAISKTDGSTMGTKTSTVTTPSRVDGRPNGC